MTKQNVVVHGPMACGKTRNAQALKRHFGLQHVVDDYYPMFKAPKSDTLILTNVEMEEELQGIPGRKVSFRQAMAEMGRRRAN